MAGLAARYPAYGFDRNKGYGTADPRDRMAQLALPGIGPQDIPSPGGAPALPPRACGLGSEGEVP